MSDGRIRLAVRLLATQAFAFGLMCALLIIPANAIFLGAYGSKWLPVTYIAVAVVGTAASGAIAQSVRRHALARVATVALGACAVIFAGAWVLLVTADAVWTSWVLVPLFPIQLQLGFVFIGGQAGRIFDVHQIKTLFPRVIAGFPLGFLVGGLLGPVLLALFGASEHMLVFSSAAQLAFVGLILLTARRVTTPAPAAVPMTDDIAPTRPPLRQLLSSRFVLLVLSYQVLSAMGSQVLDFLVFDRAAARYERVDDLARFVSMYSVALNLIDIIVLALIAGALLKRFGLRLGLAANPALVTALVVGTTMAFLATGAGSLGVFGFITAARIFDIALSDAMTRTSVAATYQVIPPDERVAVQAGVEGVGVPLAIGLTGVLLLIVSFLDLGVGAVIVMALVLCAGWAVAAVLVYGDYGRALTDRLRRRSSLVDVQLDDEHELVAARALLHGDDVTDMRLGLELLATAGDAPLQELRRLAVHGRADVRLLARSELCGHDPAPDLMDRLAQDAATACRADDAGDRRAAAGALRVVRPVIAEPLLRTLLHDGNVEVRRAALASVDGRFERLLPDVRAGLDDPGTATEARDAMARMGDTAVGPVAAALIALGPPVAAAALRPLRALRPTDATDAARHLGPLLDHRDRTVAREAARVLATVDGTAGLVADAVDRLLDDAADLAGAVRVARRQVGEADALDRALADEHELARATALAGLAVVQDAATIDDIALGLRQDDPARRALAIELLSVIVGRHRTDQLLVALIDDDATTATDDPPDESEGDRRRRAALRDLVDDPDGCWRSPWLQSCALRAAARLDGAFAAELAAAHLGADDPVVAETAAWAVTSAAAG